jgi:hypothetical protein
MLPLIGALAGSALAPSIGLSALTAGAIGSGLGTYIQTGDLEKGILSGIGSYGLGKLGGMAMGDGAKAVDPAIAAPKAAPMASPVAQSPYLSDPLVNQSLVANPTPAGAGVLKPGVQPSPMPGLGGAGYTPPTTPEVGFFDRPMPKIPTGPGRSGLPQLGSAPADSIGKTITSGITTGLTGESLAYEPPKFEKKKSSFNTEEADAPDRRSRMPGDMYRPGIDAEFDFYAREGGLARFQQGGEVQADMSNKNDKEVLDMAIMAVKGQSPMPEIVLGEFLVRFGEEALRNLVRSVQNGEVDAAAGKAEGTVNGAGDGMEDLVPASLEGQQDVMLSEGEFVVPADVVSGIGNGSTDAGADRLYDMLDRVRQSRTGTREQAPQINAPEMMPA